MEKRSKDLDEALDKAVTFQDGLQKMMVWLQTQEDTLKDMEPVASEYEAIKSQWNDIKVRYNLLRDSLRYKIRTLASFFVQASFEMTHL